MLASGTARRERALIEIVLVAVYIIENGKRYARLNYPKPPPTTHK